MASFNVPHLGWNYFSADPDWGSQKATQLVIELEASLAKYDVNVNSTVPGTVEIIPKTLSKATMPKLVLDRLMRQLNDSIQGNLTGFSGEFPLFLFAIGDDKTDDDVFSVSYYYLN